MATNQEFQDYITHLLCDLGLAIATAGHIGLPNATYQNFISELDRVIIKSSLDLVDGNVSAVSRQLKLSRPTVNKILRSGDED